MNAILCWSNECLVKIGGEIGADVSELVEWNELTIYSMNEKLWNEEEGFYQAYDLVAEQAIVLPVINSLLPLIAPLADQDQAERMLENLAGDRFGNPQDLSLCASYGVEQVDVDFARYWRGPIWINTNWLLYQGLLRYDMEAAAARIKEDSLALIKQYGFYEYYDPRPNIGENGAYGTDQFSWTAALLLWWLKREISR
jgi:neutral trehalase